MESDVKYSLLFDLDGTLLDPREGIVNSIQFALRRFGMSEVADQDLLWCIGPPLHESFSQLLQTDDEPTIRQAVAAYREYFGADGLLQNHVYTGIPELLTRLNEHAHSLFVATSKPHVFATRILQHFKLDHYFRHIHGSELDGTRANKGDLISYILQKEQLGPAHTLMIGDRKHDILGAQKCGIDSIGVLWGYGADGELEEAGASYLAADPEDLERIVQAV